MSHRGVIGRNVGVGVCHVHVTGGSNRRPVGRGDVEGPGARVEDGAAGTVQRGAHELVGRIHNRVRVDTVAPIHLEAVDPPIGVGLGVHADVPRQRAVGVLALAWVAAAGPRADVVVRAELQPFAVDVIAQRFHPRWEARAVRLELTVGTAVPVFPAVIKVDVAVARRAPLRLSEDVGVLLDERFRDAVGWIFCACGIALAGRVSRAAKTLPAHPAHRRRPCEPVVEGTDGSDQRDEQCGHGCGAAGTRHFVFWWV